MATVHHIHEPEPAAPDSVLARLLRLARLEMELGLAEVRLLAKRVLVAVIVAAIAAMALVSAMVVLLAGGVAAFGGVTWQPFVIAGGGVALLSIVGLAWSAWRLRNLEWPNETLASFEENYRWLAAQLRSKLTLR
jgi:Putative Actinobacterial Holin-X, holin superfamily III